MSCKDLLTDIGTEELRHLEIIGTLARMHLKPMKKSAEAAQHDPLNASPEEEVLLSATRWAPPGQLISK